MKVLKSETKLCLMCMENHNVDLVETEDKITFKDKKVTFKATYEYCSNTDEFMEDEEMMSANDLAMKDAYRKDTGLLTSSDIIGIREKYSISQKDFSLVLGWGGATITRYENHQVQDRAHDDVLRKLASDPIWFRELLERAKKDISPRLYAKYYKKVNDMCNKPIDCNMDKATGQDSKVSETIDGDQEYMSFKELWNDPSFIYSAQKAKIDFKVELIGKLIEARESKGLSQKDLADLSGLKQPAIARLESMKVTPQINTIIKILQPLGYTLTIVPIENKE